MINSICKNSWRFIISAVIASLVFFSGYYFGRKMIPEYARQEVSEWLEYNRSAVTVIEEKYKLKIYVNTQMPGTIWLKYIENQNIEGTVDVIMALIKMNCPYAVTKISTGNGELL